MSRIAFGTHTKIQLLINGAVFDITPTDPSYTPGLASSAPPPQYALRLVSLDNFGQNLIIAPSTLTLYTWIPPLLEPAVPLTNAPPHNQGAFVAAPQQQVIAYGSSPDGGTMDPLLVRFSDIGNDTDWDASTTNQAGSFRLSRGNRIIGGVYTPQAQLLWTDLDPWIMQYEGFPLVYGFYQIAENCGLIGQNAFAVLGNGLIPWMSDHGFYAFSGGGVSQIPCPVWDEVFLDLDQNNLDKITACPNNLYNEIAWHFPSISGGTGENDSWVRFNFENGAWDYSKNLPKGYARSAWTDQNRPGTPIAVDPDFSFIHMQDVGYDVDLDQNGNPSTQPMMGVFIQSGFSDIQDGRQACIVDRYMPDFIFEGTNPQLTVSLLFRMYPGDTPTTVGPFTVTPSTSFITLANYNSDTGQLIRPRGREWAERVESNSLGSWWRRGVPRARVFPDGVGP